MKSIVLKQSRAPVSLAFCCYAASVSAHPFHGVGNGFGAGIAHPFLGLDHVLAMVAVGFWATQVGGRWTWAIPLGFVSAMLVGGALGFLGLALPFTEPLIAVSVLAFGLLVATRARLKWLGAAIAAGFAIWHGFAHAAELPADASAMRYAIGFALSTAVLHGAGITLGLPARGNTFVGRLAGVPIAFAGCWLLLRAVT